MNRAHSIIMGDVEMEKLEVPKPREEPIKSMALMDEKRMSSMGVAGTINVYGKVKSFIKILRKRVKNN